MKSLIIKAPKKLCEQLFQDLNYYDLEKMKVFDLIRSPEQYQDLPDPTEEANELLELANKAFRKKKQIVIFQPADDENEYFYHLGDLKSAKALVKSCRQKT